MVKFIPLTCENCGGDLSVKEGLKFVTCNHCQTKFQVVQEQNTVFLEGISVNVKINTPVVETCEIVYDPKELWLWAKAIGREGEYAAATSFQDGHPAQRQAGSAHRALVLVLSKAGWVRTGQGSTWFNDHFSRTALDDSPESSILKKELIFGQFLLYFFNNRSFIKGGSGYEVACDQLEIALVNLGIYKPRGFFNSERPGPITLINTLYLLTQQDLEIILDKKNSFYRKINENMRKEFLRNNPSLVQVSDTLDPIDLLIKLRGEITALKQELQ